MDPLGPADIPVVGDVGIINIGRKGVDGAFLQSGGIFLHGGLFMWRAEASWATLDALGRTFPRRTPNGWQKVPVIAKAWRLA
jgi:hypothetical protein